MGWERGAWERTTRGEGPGFNPPPREITPPEHVVKVDKKRLRLEKNLSKFTQKGWSVPSNKKSQYVNNNYFNAPYRLRNEHEVINKIVKLLSSKSENTKHLIVSNNNSILNKIYSNTNLKNKYKIYSTIQSPKHSQTVISDIDEFKKINEYLFDKYAVKIFSDTESLDKIPDLKILSQNLYQIDDKAAKLLNDFLKSYWRYYELSNFSNIDTSLAERDAIREVKNLVNEFTSIKSYVKRLKKILELLDFNIDNLDKFNIEILKNDPTLLNEDVDDFLYILDKYQRLNQSNISASTYFDEFTSNDYILGIIANYNRYVANRKDYEEINKNITELKNQVKSHGFNVDTLNEYYTIKNNLSGYGNVIYIDDENFHILNEKIKDFLKSNMSFKEFFEKSKENILFNLNSTAINKKVNNGLTNIAEVLNQLGINLNTLAELDSHENDFKILMDYANFKDDHTPSNEQSIREYTLKLFDNLKKICADVVNGSGDVDDDLDQTMYNITTLKRTVSQIGLNISSLDELKDSFLIIADIENDATSSIFSAQTQTFLQNEQYMIHNTLDSLKSSLNFLYDKYENQSDLRKMNLDSLAESLNDQFKLRFLKSNIEGYCSFIKTFEEILENYGDLIQNTNNLMDFNNNLEFKHEIEKISEELNVISKMHENNDYSDNQIMTNRMSSFKTSIIDDFNRLVSQGVVSPDKIKGCDVKANVDKINQNKEIVRDFIKVNGFYHTDFKQIIKNNNEIILKSNEITNKLRNSNIYNFHDICSQLNKENYGYNKVQEILDLALKLNLNEYHDFAKYTLSDIRSFSKKLSDSIEFSAFIDDDLITRDVKIPSDDFDLKINSVKKCLSDLKLDDSIVDDFSQINIHEMDEISEKLNQFDKYFKKDSGDIDQQIKNYRISLDILSDLINDHYIEFKINNTKFNSLDFKANIDQFRNDLEYYIRLYGLESEINSNKHLIQKNLSNIWKGPLTDIDLIRNKLNMDKEFTQYFNEGIYTQKTLSSFSQISQSDLLFIEQLKEMDDMDLKSKYILSYKNNEKLIAEIDNLNNLKSDDFNLILDCLENINEIYKSDNIRECIKLLEYNIKYNESIKLIKEYENDLKTHSIVYYKYFDERDFNRPIEEILSKLQAHIKFTKLIESRTINERYVGEIKSNFKDFIKNVNKLENMKNKILKYCKINDLNENMTFGEIRQTVVSIDNSNIILMSLQDVKRNFTKKHASYFDSVYAVDDGLNEEDKLYLFLISKNKISTLRWGN